MSELDLFLWLSVMMVYFSINCIIVFLSTKNRKDEDGDLWIAFLMFFIALPFMLIFKTLEFFEEK